LLNACFSKPDDTGCFVGISRIPALFNDDLKYKGISRSTVNMISQQSHGGMWVKLDNSADFFHKDIDLIAKEGKLYYLPPDDNAIVF